MVDYLSTHFVFLTAEIATIGDSPNDVLMFKHSGLSIAMGNASDEVKSQANVTTDSYNDEGFAKAIERFVLGVRHSVTHHGAAGSHRGVGAPSVRTACKNRGLRTHRRLPDGCAGQP